MRFAYAHDPCFLEHTAPPGHPERPARLEAALAGLHAAGVPTTQAPIPTRAAEPDELTRVHHGEYLQELQQALTTGTGHLDADTYFSPGTWQAALCAAGAAIDLTQQVLDGKAERGFAVVRPPGHHAEPHRAMGFCLLDNIALAARAARAQGIEKLAIVDWDVHHGNGTQAAFYDDPSVLFISSHQFPLYPGTGKASEVGDGPGRGTTVNLAMPAGAGDAELAAAFDEVVLPVLDRFKPELILVSAGFDAHAADPLAGLQMSAEGFARLATALRDVADTHAQGRLIALLEGGYDLQALRDSVAAVTRCWLAPQCPALGPAPTQIQQQARRAIEATRQGHG